MEKENRETKGMKRKLLNYYNKSCEKTKKLIEKGEEIIGGIYTNKEIKKMVEMDIKSWKEAIKNNDWGFRTCIGARFFFDSYLNKLTDEEKERLGIYKRGKQGALKCY